MEIQQHDGVVVEAAGISAGLRQARREGGARGLGAAALPPPSLYRGLGGGAPTLGRWISKGAAAKGWLPPQAKWGAPPPLGFPNPRRMGWATGGAPAHYGLVPLPTLAHGALLDGWPHPVDPRDPSGGPGTIPATPETFPMAKTGPPIYKSSPLDHSGTPHDVRDLIRDSEQLSGYRILISLQP